MKKFLRPALISALVTAGLCGCVDADSLPLAPNEPNIKLNTNVQDWRDEVIYQVIIDRFNDGDINNNYNVDTRSLSRYHGGDWQGLIDKLDYLQDLGITTVWISPVVKNIEEDAGFASYQGYWTVDFIKHNVHFGDLATLRRLSDELHARGMKLIIDIVTNHVGQVFFYDINMNGQANEWLAGRGDKDKGAERPEAGELSRVTEYDPDFDAHGIDAYTSMGLSGQAPIVFFDMPSINRTAPGPMNVDLNRNGIIDNDIERMGFANPNWYHQRGRTYDYDMQYDYDFNTRSYRMVKGRKFTESDYAAGVGNCRTFLDANPAYDSCRAVLGICDGSSPQDSCVVCTDPWASCDDMPECCNDGTFPAKLKKGSKRTHRLTNYDGSAGPYLDSTARDYYQNDQTLLGDFPGGLKDVATERDDVREAMIQVFSYWIDVTDCDGFRIDTLKHVEYSFWETFAPGIRQHALERGKKNFLMFGEAFDGNDDLLAAYTTNENSVDSVFLFSQKYAIDQVFKCAPGNSSPYCRGAQNSTSTLYGWNKGESRHEKFSDKPRPNGVIDAEGKGVAPRDLLVNFLDNHDVGRYLYDRSDDKGVDSLKNALSFLLLQRGIPCIYYGTEQGFTGGNDPGNREDMWSTSSSIFTKIPELGYPNIKPFDQTNPIYTHIKKVLKLRKENKVLSRGTVSDVSYGGDTSSTPDSIYAFKRTYESQTAYIITNTHETQSVTFTNNNISGKTDILAASGSPCSVSGSSVTIPPMTTCVLL